MTFMELTESSRLRRFPLGGGQWCGAVTAEGCSWCPAHRKRVFIPVNDIANWHGVPPEIWRAAMAGRQRRRDRELERDPQPSWRRGEEFAA